MTRCLLMLLIGSVCAIGHAEPPRFSGDVQLQAAALVSADHQFALDASLQPAAALSAHGRFGFAASLRPDAKSMAAVCGSDALFSNGFESP